MYIIASETGRTRSPAGKDWSSEMDLGELLGFVVGYKTFEGGCLAGCVRIFLFCFILCALVGALA